MTAFEYQEKKKEKIVFFYGSSSIKELKTFSE